MEIWLFAVCFLVRAHFASVGAVAEFATFPGIFAGKEALVSGVGRAVLLIGLQSSRTLAIGLSRASQWHSSFVIDFYLRQDRTVLTAEVVSTGCVSVGSGSASVRMSEIAIATGSQVGVKIMSTAPGRAVVGFAVLVVAISIPGMLMVVC